jgi:NAD(P)-dependent dehydrogenase (short-subunit alcohol dehydrogenase family)
MTDIHRHLPAIFKVVREHVCRAAEGAEKAFTETSGLVVRGALRALLPTSYGLGNGVIVNQKGETSNYCELVIYDELVTQTLPRLKQGRYHLQSALATISLQTFHDRASFMQMLTNAYSVKRLQERQTSKKAPQVTQIPGKKADSVPKKLLPLHIHCFYEFAEYAQAEREAFCAALAALLKQYAPDERPDYLFPLKHEVVYRHYLLYPGEPNGYDTGLSREPELGKPRSCYICKSNFFRRHFFYEQLCQRCGDLNYAKRIQRADLTGKVALITGGRVKIGYAAALKLLRAEAEVIVTTRFPHDAAARYARETDFAAWRKRLHIYGMDLRHLPGIEEFTRLLHTRFSSLDILINNAAQTVRKTPAFYAHLMPFELQEPAELPDELRSLLLTPHQGDQTLLAPVALASLALFQPSQGALTEHIPGPHALPATLSQIPLLPGDEERNPTLFPPGLFDEQGQQIDKRAQNSWVLKLDEVQLPEMLEVQLINVTAPYLLITQLKPLMLQQSEGAKFILNVSSMEGCFSQDKLNGPHPHTNMAKAALNMLTHTSALDYAQAGIYMNSIDPGWISQQVPHDRVQLMENPHAPLDELDAAARICDPIFVGLNERRYVYGKFLKDYRVVNW